VVQGIFLIVRLVEVEGIDGQGLPKFMRVCEVCCGRRKIELE
jgi:hypothetical protein